jgi:hypothetical protein
MGAAAGGRRELVLRSAADGSGGVAVAVEDAGIEQRGARARREAAEVAALRRRAEALSPREREVMALSRRTRLV